MLAGCNAKGEEHLSLHNKITMDAHGGDSQDRGCGSNKVEDLPANTR
jgi:hypothetical protein